MKNTNTCPKCQSADILRIPGQVGSYGVGNNIPTSEWNITTAVTVTRYLCLACGFSEEWVEAPEDREKLREKYGTK